MLHLANYGIEIHPKPEPTLALSGVPRSRPSQRMCFPWHLLYWMPKESSLQVETDRALEEERSGRTDLYLRHSPAALRLAFLLTGDRALADDLVQDAFVRLFGRLLHLRNPDAFESYLRQTVVNRRAWTSGASGWSGRTRIARSTGSKKISNERCAGRPAASPEMPW